MGPAGVGVLGRSRLERHLFSWRGEETASPSAGGYTLFPAGGKFPIFYVAIWFCPILQLSLLRPEPSCAGAGLACCPLRGESDPCPQARQAIAPVSCEHQHGGGTVGRVETGESDSERRAGAGRASLRAYSWVNR